MLYLTFILGLAAGLGPFLFGYSGNTAALWTSLAISVGLIIPTVFEAFSEKEEQWEYWVMAVVGVVSVIAPFLLGFSGLFAAFWTLLVVGLLGMGAAGIKLFTADKRLGY